MLNAASAPQTLSGLIDVGVTIGGAGGGGSPWSPAQADVFYSLIRRATPSNVITFLLGWQHSFGGGSHQQLLGIGGAGPLTGAQVLDLVFARTANGVEGWAIGQSFSGSSQFPFVAHLN
jgi:hypothetical protein